MSYFSFDHHTTQSVRSGRGTLRSAATDWLLRNYGADYKKVCSLNRQREHADKFRSRLEAISQPDDTPLVGIIGAGFAGLFAGLILQSLDIPFEILESTDRVGGRIRTWYSSNYHACDPDHAGLYGELGGMRLPQFSADMLPVQHLSLVVNSLLERNGYSKESLVHWRKFYFDSPAQRMRYNAMDQPLTKQEAEFSDFDFSVLNRGNVPDVWFRSKQHGPETYLAINKVMEQINAPFLKALNRSFAEGFDRLMQYDHYSMWEYLTNHFKLGDLGDYYDPEMGPKSDFLPVSVASYLETTSVGTGMFSVSFVEMVIAVYDWGGSKNPYHPELNEIFMLTVDKGMQHFPDACYLALDLGDKVTPQDGRKAQVELGMLPGLDGFSYNPPNLKEDARPPNYLPFPPPPPPPPPPSSSSSSSSPPPPSPSPSPSPCSLPLSTAAISSFRNRVHLQHHVNRIEYDPSLFFGHGGMKVHIDRNQTPFEYPYLISTLPNGCYHNMIEGLSFEKAQALRQCNYIPAFKAFLTFHRQFWADLGERHEAGLGAAATDHPIRQIIYPSYGYSGQSGVLQIYCWANDARRLGAMSDRERIDECLRGIRFLYPELEKMEEDPFAGYNDGVTTKTWFWDEHAGGGSFALFSPGQFKYLYPTLLTPEFDGCLNFAGECCSVHHGWIVGAMDSAYNAILNILEQVNARHKIHLMQEIWGTYRTPDISNDPFSTTRLEYAYLYNLIDRQAQSLPPGTEQSIYGDSTYEFTGNVPAFVANYNVVPQSMKKTEQDNKVLQMLNAQWIANITQRNNLASPAIRTDTAVHLLEDIYYGNNFQTIRAPRFWLKDDDEFARQQLGGFMPNLLTSIEPADLVKLMEISGIDPTSLGSLEHIRYVADYRQYLSACTVIPIQSNGAGSRPYLAKPIIFFGVSHDDELVPVGIQLEPAGELFTPNMPNAENAWLLAKMQTNCAGQTLHDVGYHQLLTHQLAALISISLFSEEIFTPLSNDPPNGPAFQQHPIFKLLRPHVTKALEFQQQIYNRDYNPYLPAFPATRELSGSAGVYNIGFVYDLIFSCGRIGNYQLQDRMYNDPNFSFLNLAIPLDANRRGVTSTPFSYPYLHDASLWYKAMSKFVDKFIMTQYHNEDTAIAEDLQLQRFFDKLIPAFNYVDGIVQCDRFPREVRTVETLHLVLTQIIWQFSVQHTVVNDGAYNHAAFVPNAPTLMYALPSDKPSSQWTPLDVLTSLPSQTQTFPQLGGMNFMDIQINASVTGQGPYPQTIFGRGLLSPSIEILQDSYTFVQPELRAAVDGFYQDIRKVGKKITQRQARDISRYLALHPDNLSVPETVSFDLITPENVMSAIQT